MRKDNNEQSLYNIYSPLYHILSVFFLCLGMTGIILMSASVPEIILPVGLLIAVSSGIMTVLYISNLVAKPLFYAVLAAVVVFCIFYTLSDRIGFATQWQYLFGGMPPSQDALSGDIGRVALVLTIFFSLLIFFFDILLRQHVVAFFITTAFILIPSVFGYSFPAYAIIMTVIYQLAFFVLPLSFKKSFTKSEKLQQRIRVKSTLLTIAAAFAALAIAVPITFGMKENTFNEVARMENSVLNNLGLSPLALLYNDEGNVNRGDNEHNGIITLRLSADRKPAENIYMRGYFGGNYYGDYWDANTDNVIFEAIAASSSVTRDPAALSSYFNALRFHTTTVNRGSDQDAIRMNVRNLNINHSVIFTPYNASEADTGKGSSYDFGVYEYGDLSMSFSDGDPDELLACRQLFRDYYADAYDNYTYVTAESIPKLKELVKEHPLEDLSSITSFIIQTLDEHAEYTLTPGAAPDGADTVDYFLFENHKGYCQQFASAAVLMYRLYGIPARYATGFKVKPEYFSENSASGTYEAEVTDNSAHAWPEILLPEYGWVPVEVTPASGGTGFTWGNAAPENSALSDEYNPVPEATESNANVTEESMENNPDGDYSLSDVFDDEEGSDNEGRTSDKVDENKNNITTAQILPWLIPLIAGGAGIAVWLLLRKRVINDEHMSFERIYRRLKLLLSNAPEPVSCNPYDKEFPEQLIKAVPSISEAEATAAHESILAALYGKGGADNEHTQALKELYDKCAGYIIPHSPAGKRAVMKYLRMLG